MLHASIDRTTIIAADTVAMGPMQMECWPAAAGTEAEIALSEVASITWYWVMQCDGSK